MTEQTNIDHIIDLNIYSGGLEEIKVELRIQKNAYPLIFRVIKSPTANCQVSSASNIGSILLKLNKYQIRNLFIKLRRNPWSKRILLLDIHKREADYLKTCIANSAIIGDLPYKSTNGSDMEILLIKLISIRQLKLPKITI